ncbi:MAG: S-layer homology domain-containing protein [Chloroflexia bacterium]
MGTIEDNLKCISRRALPAFALLAVWALVSALSLPPLGGAAANPGGNRLPAGFMAPNPLPTVQPSLTAPWTPLPTFTATPVGSATPVGTATPCQGAAQDVPPTHPDYEAIRFLLCRGAMETFPCGQPGEPCVPPNNYPYFRPGTLVTREETTMYLTLAEGWALYCPGTPTFTDVPPSSRFYCFVETLYHYGAISLFPATTMAPSAPATR